MKTTTTTRKARHAKVIHFNGSPFVSQLVTNNTEPFSMPIGFHVLTLIKKGRLGLSDEHYAFEATEGNLFFSLRYSAQLRQRILDPQSRTFESIVISLDPDLLTYSLPGEPVSFDLKTFNPNLNIPIEALGEHFISLITDLDARQSFSAQEASGFYKTFSAHIGQSPELMHLLALDRQVAPLVEFLMRHLRENLSIEALAHQWGLSTSSFYRLVVKMLGTSPYQWIKSQRLHLARCEMQFAQKRVSEIYLDVGFEDMAHFSKAFKEKFGYSPKDNYDVASFEMVGD